MTDDTKQCPYCAETIKAEAKVCRFCGRDLFQTEPINSTPVAPAKQKKSSNKTLLFVIIGAVLGCCGLFTLVAAFSNATPKAEESVSSSMNTTQNLSEPTLSQPPAAVAQTIAPSIQEILAKVEGMTDAQRNQYDASLEGNQIKGWRGTVSDVDEGEIFGGFSVYVDMVESNFLPEVSIEVSKDVALSLSKGQEIEFSGSIDHVSDIMGTTVYVNNVIINPIK